MTCLNDYFSCLTSHHFQEATRKFTKTLTGNSAADVAPTTKYTLVRQPSKNEILGKIHFISCVEGSIPRGILALPFTS